MSGAYIVSMEGLDFSAFDKVPDEVLRTARMAVNAAARRGRTMSARSMERQVNFPRGYLTGDAERLKITKMASGNDLEARIRGRDRPTSLARFIRGPARLPGQGAPRAAGVTVEVKPGIARRMPGAFVMKLKNNNLGLALRSKRGRPPSQGAKLIGKNLYLMYGPSVDQVFNKTRGMVAPDIEKYMHDEFLRLLDVKL